MGPDHEEIPENEMSPEDNLLLKFVYPGWTREEEDIFIRSMDSLESTPEWKTYIFTVGLSKQTDEYKALIDFNPGATIVRSLPLSVMIISESDPPLSEEEIKLYDDYMATPERQVYVKAWKAYWILLKDKMRAMDSKERAKQLNLRCIGGK